jgi:phosphate acetyltransferase
MQLLDSIKQKAKQENKTIVLPEGTEERTLKAANIILEEGISRIILLGNREEIMNLAAQHGLGAIERATIIDPETWERRAYFAQMLFEIRQHKGLTLEEADKLVADPLYLATLLIKNGDADG